MPPFAVIKLKVEAEVAGFLFDDVVQYASSWAMNSIPTASLLVAVGRNVATGNPATIHSAISSLKQQQKIEVFLTATVTQVESAEPGVPDQVRMKIFEGKIVGTGWRRGYEGAHFTINMLHWLGDLNYTSAISASSHPGNPSDYTYPAAYRALGRGDDEGAGGNPTWIPIVDDSLVATFQDDLWTNTLKPWMMAITDDDPFEVSLLGGQPGGGDDNSKDALTRIIVDPDAPLAVDLNGSNGAVIQHGLAQALLNETNQNFTNTTLWGKLVGEYAPSYFFSVIPRVEDCLIVPFAGGLQGEPWAVIGTEDYVQSDLNAQLHQVLRAVGITHPVMSMSGWDMNRGAMKLDRGGCAGWYQPDGQKKGVVLLKSAPKWLADSVIPYVFSATSQGVEGDPIGTSVDEVTGKPQFPANDILADQVAQKGVMSAYAHQWFVLESLKGRIGELSGKLRFDICPGSNVLVKAGGARNIQQDDLVEDIYGTVMQVSYLINSESQKAGTAFTLAHIRTEQENTEPQTSVAGPPLYVNKWVGGTMVPQVAPEET